MTAPVLHAVSADQAEKHLVPRAIADEFIPVASIQRLGGERDANHLVQSPDGSLHVLKIVGPAEADSSIPLQIAALDHLASTAPELPLPRVVPTRDGRRMLPLDAGVAWMLTFKPGRLLSDAPPEATTLAALGEATGILVERLAGFEHPLWDRQFDWRLDRAHAALDHLPYVADPAVRALAVVALNAEARDRAAIGRLPRQAIHGDLNPFNVIIAEDGTLAGLIDFGDLHHGPRAAELAIAASYHLTSGRPALVELFAGYLRHSKLTQEERDLLPVMMGARLGMTIAITARRAAERPDNADYLLRNAPGAVTGLSWLMGGGRQEIRSILESIAP